MEVTGSNPVAPTIRINHLPGILLFCVAPDCSNCSAMCLKSLCDRGIPSTQIAQEKVAITLLRHRNAPGSRVPIHRSHRRELSAPAAVAPAACACDGFWALLLIPRSSRFRAWLTSREWNWPSCSRLISTARAHQPQHPKPRSRMRPGHSMG